MIYFKPDFANGSIGSAKGASSVTMVGNGGCVIEEVTPPQASGIIAITISPELTLTPTLESLLPIEDCSEVEVAIASEETLTNGDTYTITATPSSDYYIIVGGTEEDSVVGNDPGESVSYTGTVQSEELNFTVVTYASMDDENPAAQRTFLITANEK